MNTFLVGESLMRQADATRTLLARENSPRVVPAQAGTHNHRSV
jgi:hypothetical protein